MSDTRLEQTSSSPSEPEMTEPGALGLMEVTQPPKVAAPTPPANVQPVPAAAYKGSNRAATVEHLAARRSPTPLTADDPVVKQQMSDFRAELTTLVTDLRWGGASVQATVEQLIPLLNVGPLQQWIPVLIPTILETDRAGNLIPAWLKILDSEEPNDLPEDANPADTEIGRARRVALLMLGYYKSPELSHLLGKLAADPRASLYATQSLVRQGTVAALQALASALKDARGWAKVDVIDAFATLNQARFYELMLASGFDDADGLESYLAVPLYRTLPLETYLRGDKGVTPRMMQQAALVFGQVVQDNTQSSAPGALSVVFERDLPALVTALFTGARNAPSWQNAFALHRLGMFLGRYWAEISRGMVQNSQITEPVLACLPTMPAIEAWMNGPGRDALLQGLAQDEQGFGPCLKALRELRETRASSALLEYLNATTQLNDREHAVRLGQVCETLVQLQDRRAVPVLLNLLHRVIPVQARAAQPKRRDNLAPGDPAMPASIVYAAALRAFAGFGDRGAYDAVQHATKDFDPYVRTQALEALRSLDARGEDSRSRSAAREGLSDPRDTVVRVAFQLVAQYRDMEAIPQLSRLIETRPELAPVAQHTLQQISQ